jgi:uncharacterized protein (TIGR00369 family)
MSGIVAPEGFRHWAGDPAEDRIGPFFYRVISAGRVQNTFTPVAHHCNTYGNVHGGVLMTFADQCLCLAACESEADVVVTVSATCDFVDAAVQGEALLGDGELVRMAGSLAFTRVTVRAGERVVMVASGVVKRVRPKTP